MDQARRMLNLVIKVDVAIKHLSPKAKAEVRYNRQELLISLPVQRVWLFLKNIRNIRRLSHPEVEGIEDVVARSKYKATLVSCFFPRRGTSKNANWLFCPS